MMITSKSRYALKVMMDLASKPVGELEQRHGIAARQGIPADYIDQILIRLRQGGLVESVRGRSGGFCLKKDPKDITVWDILSVSEDSLYPVLCLTHVDHNDHDDCSAAQSCTTRGPWEDIVGAIQRQLASIRLSDLVERWGAVPLKGDVTECRAPRRTGAKVGRAP